MYDNRLWLLGGKCLTESVFSERFVSRNDVWYSSDGAFWQQADTAPWSAGGLMGTAVLNDELWVLGGAGPYFPTQSDGWYMSIVSGEGEGEGEGEGGSGPFHSADLDQDGQIDLSELLGMIQLYFYGDYHCDASADGGYAPRAGDESCAPHSADDAPQDWFISLGELLRVVQLYNSSGYHACAEGEDGFCPGAE